MNNFDDISKEIKEFCNERDWSQFHDPKNLAISLNLESAEVLELFQWTKDNEVNPEKINELPDELADVLYWVIMLSNHYPSCSNGGNTGTNFQKYTILFLRRVYYPRIDRWYSNSSSNWNIHCIHHEL